ncbi:neopullulanase [Lachnospiraceae bacterium KM106-2]|nr:neopullulanase [Lachnospiraceae bacterium KM106-2]
MTGRKRMKFQVISWVLSIAMIFCMMPQNLAFAAETEDTLRSPVIQKDGSVTFNYQGDDSTGDMVARGDFNDWKNLDMTKNDKNIFSLTTDVTKTPGIYTYGFEDVTESKNAVAAGEKDGKGWKGDPLNPYICHKNSNPTIFRNPIVESKTQKVTLYYPSTKEISGKVYYKQLSDDGKYQSVDLKLSEDYDHVYQAEITADAGTYAYYFDIDGTKDYDENNLSSRQTVDDVDMPTFTTTEVAKPSEEEENLKADEFTAQPGGSIVWRVTGKFDGVDNWDVQNEKTVMKHLVGEYYVYSMVLDADTYEFKFTENGSWDNEKVGSKDPDYGDNFKFTLYKRTKVNFYVNGEKKGYDRFRTNIKNEDLQKQGIAYYEPKLSEKEWPRLVGDLQEKIGDEKNWSPKDAKSMFVDYNFDGTVYKLQRKIPAGKYECKVCYGDDFDTSVDYGDKSANHTLNVLDTSNITFTTEYKDGMKDGEGKLTDDYKPTDSIYDGKLNKDGFVFDSRDITYKNPFGAIKQGEQDATFRFATDADDAEYVKLELIDGKGVSKQYDMKVVTTLEKKDYWEVKVKKEAFDAIGIWGYKFIVIDGSTKLEYGDDGTSGGSGAVSEEGQTAYNLTVYAKDYKTPDWMKNAVVYQIFPDRFFDGNTSNNKAKEQSGVRGYTDENGKICYYPVQYFDGDKWSTLPENPRQSEEVYKPYYKDATTDNVWSNEFYGGDLEGVEAKLDYLKNLGVTVIYLNPVAWAASNHKYDATDYQHLDPMFGQPVYKKDGDPSSGLDMEKTKAASDKVYETVAKACKAKNVRLLCDGVFNHVGDDSIYFDRYEKYPEIGAYEFWARVYKTIEKEWKVDQATYEVAHSDGESEKDFNKRFEAAKDKATKEAKEYYKSQVNEATGEKYADDDFKYITWFDVNPKKVKNDEGVLHYDYEGWWGYDSLPVIKSFEASATNLTNDENATIAGTHEYNNVGYRNEVIGYDISDLSDEAASTAMQKTNSQRWLWMGASGWRLDVAPDVSNETWAQFRKAVKSTKDKKNVNGETMDDPVILGEEWGVATKYLLGDMFDSVMNYQFRAALQTYLTSESPDAAKLNESLEIIRENYPKEAWEVMLNLVDSHDTTRNITKMDHPDWEEENVKNAEEASATAIKKQALTAIFQLGYPGAPTIYYGDEVGVVGTKDPDSRRTFPWERIGSDNKITSKYAEKYGDLYNTYVKAASVRENNEDIFVSGDMKTAYAKDSVIVYARKGKEKAGLLVINNSAKEQKVEANVKDFLPDGMTLVDQLDGTTTAKVKDSKITLSIPKYTGYMMVSNDKLTSLPASPSGVKAEASKGADPYVTISWDKVEGADSYNVYRTMLDGVEGEKVASEVRELTYKDAAKDLKNGTRYYYYIKAVKDGLESISSEVVSAMPVYAIEKVEITQEAKGITIGVGKKTDEILITMVIPGLTDQEDYIGKDVSGIKKFLEYTSEDKTDSGKVLLRYKGDVLEDPSVTTSKVIGKSYYATFEPMEKGTYEYWAMVSVDNGENYQNYDKKSVEMTLASETALIEAPTLNAITEESNRVTLEWKQKDDKNVKGYIIYRKEEKDDSFSKLATVSSETRGYVDYTVSNDTKYQYKVVAYDENYNKKASNTEEVTPKLTMVDVTVQLTIPSYTPATDNIYMACDANGWNASGWQLKKPSGATDNTIVEYTFKMMAGKSVQYKYTRGSWDTEAFSSVKEGAAKDLTLPGNYAYSSTDTNYSFKVSNQGKNKMLVKDTVLRWKDMPLMINLPRTSLQNEKIEYTTDEDSFKLQASVPFGVEFTINGKDINAVYPGAMDQYGNVRVDKIPLRVGKNEIKLHIEPTEETKKKFFSGDTGRVSQATADKTLTITRTGSEGGDEEKKEPEETKEPEDKKEIALTAIKFNTTSVILAVGETKQQTIEKVPANTTSKDEFIYSSSKEAVAKVDGTGKVTAVGVGNATITCKVKGHEDMSASYEVIVAKVSLDQTDMNLYLKETKSVKAAIEPASLTNQSVTFTSSDEKIATVNPSGEITGVAKGKAVITCALQANTGIKASVNVTVSKKSTSIPKVKGKVTAKQTSTVITLKWTKVANTKYYIIYQYNTKQKKYVKLAKVSAKKTSYQVKKLKSATAYQFKVTAYKLVKNKQTKLMSYTISTGTAPKTTTIRGKQKSKTRISYSLKKVLRASGYEVSISTHKTKSFKKCSAITGNKKLSKIISKLKKKKTYYLKARAYKTIKGKKVYGSYSKVIKIKMK